MVWLERLGEQSPFVAMLGQPTLIDFPGKLAVMFFVGPCNLSCGYCHNVGLRKIAETYPTREILKVCNHYREEWVNGVVISGGEPTLREEINDWIQFFRDACKWSVKLDTNGTMPNRLELWLPHVDYVAMDYKAPLSRYPTLLGMTEPDKIRQSKELLIKGNIPYEFRMTYVKELLSFADLIEMKNELYGAKRLAIQAFVPRDHLLDPAFANYQRPSLAQLEEVANLFRDAIEEVIVRG